MNNKLLNGFIAGALATTLALASPALARGGGGGGHGGGMGGGMHGGGMGGGAHFSGMSGAHFSGSRFAGAHFAHSGFSPRFSRFAVHGGRFFHHRHHRFAFVGLPYTYAAYDGCWRRVWTSYGLRWVNVCYSDYY